VERQADNDGLSSLEAELHTWRKTPFDRLLTRQPLFRPTALTEATAKARRVGREQLRLQDIRATLVAVVAAVEQAHPAAPARAPAGAICSPGIIREVFGLTDASENASTQAREELAGRAVTPTLSWQTIRKYHRVYVDQLALWIRSQQPASERRETTGDMAPHVIPRPADLAWLHATYRNLVADNGGLFLLWGLDGTGKSTLARHFADQVGPPQVIGFVRLGRRSLYELDIRQVLSLEGIDDSSLSDEQCVARFRDVATRFTAIRLLVLDDTRAESDILALVPHRSNIPVLVTAPEYLRLSNLARGGPPPALQLTAVSDDETLAYLKDQLPEVADSTVRKLVSLLGGHVETIHHVAHYLTNDDAVTAEDLLEDIARRAQHALNDLAEVLEAPKSLPLVIQQLYEAVSSDPMASAILTSLVWTHGSGERPRDLIIEVVSHLVHRPSALELQAAIRRLERVGLVTATKTSFAVPRLTAQILRDLLIGSRGRVLIAYERAIAQPAVRSQGTLLEILRQEYAFLAPLRSSFAKALSNMHMPPPAVLPLDDTTWAVFVTDERGDRQAELYRLTPHAFLHLKSDGRYWKVLDDSDVNWLADLTALVYPTIRSGWEQANGDSANRPPVRSSRPL
jgi:AAA domain-containing protein